MGKSLKVFYNCMNCPSYCCSYPRLIVSKTDVRRLARHFGVTEQEAHERFTKRGWTDKERVLRHQKDEVYGSVCRFLDTETRLCTVHTARPGVCRGHPGGPTCAYYVFLSAERAYQDDPHLEARAYNVPGEWPHLEAGD